MSFTAIFSQLKMSLHKSYLYMAARAIHRLNGNNLGVTIPEIYFAITKEFKNEAANVDLVS